MEEEYLRQNYTKIYCAQRIADAHAEAKRWRSYKYSDEADLLEENGDSEAADFRREQAFKTRLISRRLRTCYQNYLAVWKKAVRVLRSSTPEVKYQSKKCKKTRITCNR